MSEKRKIVAIHAHPDDIEIQCAGTLALLAKSGHEISIATMTPGDCGSDELEADEIACVRRGEAIRSAEILGATYTCLEFRDLSIVFDNESRRRVAEYLRKQQPDIVITAPPVDYMPDHEITSQLVRDAGFNAAVPNYRTRQWDPAPKLQKIPHLYYVDAVAGVDYFGDPIEPGFVVDVSDTFETRQKMLACHSSQREWLRRQHGIDEYMEMSERWAVSRGEASGAKDGEGFRKHLGHP